MSTPRTKPPLYTPEYAADHRHRVQLHDWTCSIVATWWAICSLGIHAKLGYRNGEQFMQADDGPAEYMVKRGHVTEAHGLMRRDGVGIVDTIAHYVERAGAAVSIERIEGIEWKRLVEFAGNGPGVLGSHAWGKNPDGSTAGHWCAVRDAMNGQARLMNPARRIDGGNYDGVGQSLTEEQFALKKPWNAVFAFPVGGDLLGSERLTIDDAIADIVYLVDVLIPKIHRESVDDEREKLMAEAVAIKRRFAP